MAHTTEPCSLSQDETDAFTVQVLRYLDGDCAADEARSVCDLLSASAAHLALFVQLCRLFGRLYEHYAPRRAQLKFNTDGAAAAETIVHDASPEDRVHPAPQQPRE